jgi:hypothetical protein
VIQIIAQNLRRQPSAVNDNQTQISPSMSQTLPPEQESASHEPPIYTEGPPLIWIELSGPERWIEGIPWAPHTVETVPISLRLYAALHKVSCLVATYLTKPDGQRLLAEPGSRSKGLSGLLLYLTTLIFKINHCISFPL